MNDWDWIQWMYVFFYSLNLVLGFIVHGKPRKMRFHDFRWDTVSALISLPILGRILEWW